MTKVYVRGEKKVKKLPCVFEEKYSSERVLCFTWVSLFTVLLTRVLNSLFFRLALLQTLKSALRLVLNLESTHLAGQEMSANCKAASPPSFYYFCTPKMKTLRLLEKLQFRHCPGHRWFLKVYPGCVECTVYVITMSCLNTHS